MNTINEERVLINRMKTDDINRMLEFSHTYKISGQYLIDRLMETDSWLNLEYDVVCHLNDVFKCGYSPSEICVLFKNK